MCDHINWSFRSGAVEQLRVHVRNLSMLGVNGAGESKGRVELFERRYGKDAAGIAREAIHYGSPYSLRWSSFLIYSLFAGRDNNFDVVLIDTAGRMQDNEVYILSQIVTLAERFPTQSASDACTRKGKYK